MTKDAVHLLILIFVVFWAMIWGLRSLIIAAHLSVGAKTAWINVITVIRGVGVLLFIFIGYAVTTHFSIRTIIPALVLGFIVCLITWSGIRKIYRCSKCANLSASSGLFSKSFTCPYCGHNLK